MLKGAMAGKGWHSARPLLTWLAWILVTWLLGFLLFMLANAHTHIPAKIMVIRLIALGYLFLGATLVVYLVKRLRAGNSPEAG
jgi:hypothetical protein